MEEVKSTKEYVNVYIDVETKQMYSSDKPYPTKEESDKEIFIGPNIEKIVTLEIQFLSIQ